MDHHLGRLTALLLLASTGCAPLFLAGRSEQCRRNYDACLNGCPQPAQTQPGHTADLQIDVASCTNQCNEKAQSCR